MMNLISTAVRALTFCALAALSICPTLAQIQHQGQPLHWNDDGTVSVADVLAVLSEFGCTSTCTFVVNADGNVNVTDVLQLLSAFGLNC